MIMFAPVTDRPADLRRVGFRPPAIQLGKIQSAINQHFHATCATRFPGTSRRVHPEIYTLNQLLGHEQVVVTQKDYSRPHFRAMGELDPLPDHLLTLHVLGMGLPSEYELDRAFPIGQDGHKPLRIMQEKVGTLVRRKTASKAQSQSVSVKRLSGPRKILRRGSPACKLPGVLFANVVNERLTAISPKLPYIGVSAPVKSLLQARHRFAPTFFSTRDFPQAASFDRVPCRRVHPACHVCHRDFELRPPRKQYLKDSPADLTVPLTNSANGAAAPHGQIGHI